MTLHDLSTLYRRRDAVSRSISAENPDGARGRGGRATSETTLHPPSAEHARDLGPGWKLSPCRPLPAGEAVVLMDHDGPGVIRHVWVTLDARFYRDVVLRIYWDGQDAPAVECPIGDFFCCCWNARQVIFAQPVNVNPSGGMNLYFPLPFREHARITVANEAPEDVAHFFYVIDFTLEPVPGDALYFHARWSRTNPVPYKTPYTILDGVRGQGHYVGTFLAWQQNSKGWWGEGEVKMYLDGDEEYPTICGTGTEDYFGGAWCFRGDYSAPYLGYQCVAGGAEQPGARHTMYRFHVLDPVFFRQDLRVTVQPLGWRREGRYLPLQDDLASVAYWYQTPPHVPFPELPGRDSREIV